MGNQGTKNWKFSAFFVVSLMLIASLFSNAAMAAVDDGKGTVADNGLQSLQTAQMVTCDNTTPFQPRVRKLS